jgi:hypothetical protein
VVQWHCFFAFVAWWWLKTQILNASTFLKLFSFFFVLSIDTGENVCKIRSQWGAISPPTSNGAKTMAKLSDSYTTLVPANIAGIPCLLGIDDFYRQPADFGACNRDDFFGYVELEFTVMDRKGYKADWLVKKITPVIDRELEKTVLEYFA